MMSRRRRSRRRSDSPRGWQNRIRHRRRAGRERSRRMSIPPHFLAGDDRFPDAIFLALLSRWPERTARHADTRGHLDLQIDLRPEQETTLCCSCCRASLGIWMFRPP